MSDESPELAAPVEAPPVAVEDSPADTPEPSGPYVWHEDGSKVYVTDADAAAEGWPRLRQVKSLDGGLFHHVGEKVDVVDDTPVVHWTYRVEP